MSVLIKSAETLRAETWPMLINISTILLFLIAKAYYIWRNRQKERAWHMLTDEQQTHYRKTTKLQGSRRLDFRFAH